MIKSDSLANEELKKFRMLNVAYPLTVLAACALVFPVTYFPYPYNSIILSGGIYAATLPIEFAAIKHLKNAVRIYNKSRIK